MDLPTVPGSPYSLPIAPRLRSSLKRPSNFDDPAPYSSSGEEDSQPQYPSDGPNAIAPDYPDESNGSSSRLAAAAGKGQELDQMRIFQRSFKRIKLQRHPNGVPNGVHTNGEESGGASGGEQGGEESAGTVSFGGTQHAWYSGNAYGRGGLSTDSLLSLAGGEVDDGGARRNFGSVVSNGGNAHETPGSPYQSFYTPNPDPTPILQSIRISTRTNSSASLPSLNGNTHHHTPRSPPPPPDTNTSFAMEEEEQSVQNRYSAVNLLLHEYHQMRQHRPG